METSQGWSDGYLPAAGEEVQVLEMQGHTSPYFFVLGLVPHSAHRDNISMKLFQEIAHRQHLEH